MPSARSPVDPLSSSRLMLPVSRPQALCVAYVALHLLSHFSARWFEVQPGVATSIWYPPAGFALALLILLGPRFAPVVFAANVAGALFGTELGWPTVFFPAMITVVYAGTAGWVRARVGPRLLPGTPRDTLVFCTAVVGAPLVAASIGMATTHLGGLSAEPLTPREFLNSVFQWWVGDASGLLTVVPAAVVFLGPWLAREPVAPRIAPPRRGGAAMLALRWSLLVGTLLAVLAIPPLRDHNAFYLCFLPLVWICVTQGLRGATIATLVVTLVGLVGMRLLGTTAEASYIFLLFEIAAAGVGLGLGTLVSRRDEAEQKLAASQAQLERAIAGAHLGLWDWNLASDQLESNHRLADMLGYAAAEMPALTEGRTELLHPADRPRVEAALAAHVAGQVPLYEVEYRLRAKDGQWRWIHSRGSIVARDERGRPVRISGTHLDITDRKRAEAEIERLRRIVEATPDLVLSTDREGRVLFANAALLSVCALEARSVIGRELATLFPGEGGRRLRAEALPAALAAGTWRGEIELTSLDGRVLPTSQVVLAQRDEPSDAWVVSFIMRDISEQRRAEAERIAHHRELLQLQKNESLVVLAGGIAHDFNNLLTAVVCNTNLARLELPEGAPTQALLANIEQASERAAGLCHQMLAYAGKSPVAFDELDLSRLIEETAQLLAPGLSRKIVLDLDLERPIALVLGATAQLQQVAMNLALNAADAIGDAAGRITLRTRSGVFTAAELEGLLPGAKLGAGLYVLLEVEDTGCGMSAEIQARIFEPFYTTKFTGQGLGLAAVSGIVKTHRGAMAVQSAPGAGARFRVALPALPVRSSAEPVAPSPDKAWRGFGRVLVVDDDYHVRQVASLLLERLGFDVMTAKDGASGLAAFRANADALRCVLLDLTMAGLDGVETHTQMHRIDPRVPVILMSGYSQRLGQLPPESIHPAAVMPKPFSLEQLRMRLQAVLEPVAALRSA